MEGLSILIPTYNYACVTLVRALHAQAIAAGIPFEILVGDDGSTESTVIHQNMAINQLENSRVIRLTHNIGRSAIRNMLAGKASYSHLLFIDSDMTVFRNDYLEKYLQTKAPVVDGGIIIRKTVKGNLRSLYEKAEEDRHRAEQRQLRPYHEFHTANFMIQRDVMLKHLFDERYRRYGYEDVAFGIALQASNVEILHIDNPMSFEVFEPNDTFLSKTEEGLQTLWHFCNELKDYSRMLQLVNSLPAPATAFLRCIHRWCGGIIRQNLMGNHPSLFLFKIYKVGYYLDYAKRQSCESNP